MPRMSDAEKQRSHSRILDAAARLFREHGIEATSVADVMEGAGMTHGGFYRHFRSKEDLVAAAFRHAVNDVVSDIEQETTAEGRMRATETYIDTYLSEAHVQGWDRGCPLAAMGVDLARARNAQRHEGAEASARMAGILQQPDAADSTQGLAMMALMMGAVTLARVAENEADSERALEAGRTGIALLKRHWPAV